MTKAWKEKVVFPTYKPGLPEKNPVFLEKRVYQGSSGVVYPYPVTESVADEPEDVEYDAVYLENEYIKVMVLPELGGRIQMAYDKIRGRHFVYFNHVVKPALVGLAGPWISGGIEFNWPQHHRPSTFMPVDSDIRYNADGSVSVLVNEVERMTGQKGTAAFTLHPGKAYLQIDGTLYNPTRLPQTFLWWANPAVAVNDHYRSVFPPDINAVFDHGKRAVSSFPVATGTYYKMDYSAGVDIANYKNIYVPTSYMGVNSRFDFEGGYEFDTQAGMLHVADRHVSPGKKQWTWGNGDFGRAWDRNLTDADGPYIELMAGVFTENQPDFSWLMPNEEKVFTQYFMPYREVGMVKNASRDFVASFEVVDGEGIIRIMATSRRNVSVEAAGPAGIMFTAEAEVSPESVFEAKWDIDGIDASGISIYVKENGRTVLSIVPESEEIRPVPPAAEAPLAPEDMRTVEQLYLAGLHLEQYRHATMLPETYYMEGLRREPADIRCNNAMGKLMLRRGRADLAEPYLRKAVAAWTRRNPNPYDGEPLYNLGLCLLATGRRDEAYDCFYKATWNAAWQDAGFLECARISSSLGEYERALEEVDRSLARNYHGHSPRALRCALLLALGCKAEAAAFADESLSIDEFNYGAMFVKYRATGDGAVLDRMIRLMHDEPNNYDETALQFVAAGFDGLAVELWKIAIARGAATPMTHYYIALALDDALAKAVATGDDAEKTERLALGVERELEAGASAKPDFCFPKRSEAIAALSLAIRRNPSDGMARYYLGNLYYDKRQHSMALRLWEEAARLCPDFPTVWRNLALAYFNKENQPTKALECLERAFALDPTDARILMELDQLRRRLHHSHESRLESLSNYPDLVGSRDDLYLEYATLLNITGQPAEAKKMIDSRQFHPWEGGEGKVPAQYQSARRALALKAMDEGRWEDAVGLLEECLEYPHHLGEGKLYGAQENDFHYLLAIARKALGEEAKARENLEKATEGPTEPAPALYYNDAKPDKIFYAGLAFRALGDEKKARGYFNRLADYGRQHYHDVTKPDYFAVSLPDLQIWDDSLDTRNRVHCLYMLALGNEGLGNRDKAMKYLSEALNLDPNHQDALAFRNFIEFYDI